MHQLKLNQLLLRLVAMHKYWMFGPCQRIYFALFAATQQLKGFISVHFGRKRGNCHSGCSFLAFLCGAGHGLSARVRASAVQTGNTRLQGQPSIIFTLSIKHQGDL